VPDPIFCVLPIKMRTFPARTSLNKTSFCCVAVVILNEGDFGSGNAGNDQFAFTSSYTENPAQF
jgi:hypothetical protein